MPDDPLLVLERYVYIFLDRRKEVVILGVVRKTDVDWLEKHADYDAAAKVWKCKQTGAIIQTTRISRSI